jgi:hypothetical protein
MPGILTFYKRLWRCVSTQGIKFGLKRFKLFNKAMHSAQGPEFWAARCEELAVELESERKYVGAGHMKAAARDMRDREIDTTD